MFYKINAYICDVNNDKTKKLLKMKTQKLTTTITNIEKLELNKTSLVYKWILELVNEGERTFRPIFSTGGSWKHSSLIDKSFDLTNTLKKLNIDFEVGNDSPRGGKTGYFVNITTKFYL